MAENRQKYQKIKKVIDISLGIHQLSTPSLVFGPFLYGFQNIFYSE
jgi:hypothetical protein